MASASPVFVIVGGGIAGVTCAEELSRLSPSSKILLISSSPLIKAVTNFIKISRSLEYFDISEKSGDFLTRSCPNITVIHSSVSSLDPTTQTVHWASDSQSIKYDKLCVCTGGIPKIITNDHQHVIGIRDTESVQDFQQKLGSARRILVVGNGGIAVELVYEVHGCEVVWAIKDKSIGQTFFDEGAASFFLPHLSDSIESTPEKPDKCKVYMYKRTKYTVEPGESKGSKEKENIGYGSALGPDWSAQLNMTGRDLPKAYRHVHVEYECEVASILSPSELQARCLRPLNFPSQHEALVRKRTLSEVEPPSLDSRSVNPDNTGSTSEYTDMTTKSPGASENTDQTSVNPENTDKTSVNLENTDKSSVNPENTEKASVNPENTEKASVNPENTDKTSVNLESTDKSSVNPENTEKVSVNPEITDWPVYVELTTGKVYGCDFVVSATGVVPNTAWLKKALSNERDLKLDDDGGVIVDSVMRSSVTNVYAAGDVCTLDWKDHSNTWFPMRLWTQARQMGAYAARCMDAHYRNESMMFDFCFELFAHVTKFFGYKVVLLGRYNAQGLGKDYELLIRCTKGLEYIKVVLQRGRMVGAILIGETDLEETFENLILNRMDLSRFGESLLDPDIDIEDYFD